MSTAAHSGRRKNMPRRRTVHACSIERKGPSISTGYDGIAMICRAFGLFLLQRLLEDGVRVPAKIRVMVNSDLASRLKVH